MGGGGGSSWAGSWSLSLPESKPMSFGMPSSTGLPSTISNKEEKPPPFPTRAEFRKALQEEERKAELARFRPGSLVEIKGLVNNNKLNGAEGTVVSTMPDGHIMTVKVQLTDSGKQYCVRPQNMILQTARGGTKDASPKFKRSRSTSSSSSTSSTRSNKRKKKAAKKKAKNQKAPKAAAPKAKQAVAAPAVIDLDD